MTNLWTIWHRQGHLNNDKLASLFRNGRLEPFVDNKMLTSLLHFRCISYCLGKSHTLPFPISDSRASTPFDMVHSDV